MISAWPMRGGPVVRDNKVYVAASIWPFMGTFIYSLLVQMLVNEAEAQEVMQDTFVQI